MSYSDTKDACHRKQQHAQARAVAATSEDERQMWTDIAEHWSHMALKRALKEREAAIATTK